MRRFSSAANVCSWDLGDCWVVLDVCSCAVGIHEPIVFVTNNDVEHGLDTFL